MARTDISLEDALHRVGIKAFEILCFGCRSNEVMVIVAVSQAQQGSQVDRSQGLHPALKSTDQGGQAGISVNEGLVEALTEAGMAWAFGQGLVVGGIDEQLCFFALWGVTAGKGQAAVAVEDLEVFSEQMDANGRAGQRRRDGVATATHGNGAVVIDGSDVLLIDGEALVGQRDQQVFLGQIGLIGYPAGGAVDPAVADLSSCLLYTSDAADEMSEV